MDKIKEPPCDRASEYSILRMVLKDNKFIWELATKLNTDDFFYLDHKVIYESMLELSKENIGIDFVTLRNKILEKDKMKQFSDEKGYTDWSENLCLFPKAEYLDDHINIIKENSKLRKCITIGYDLEGKGFAHKNESLRPIGKPNKIHSEKIINEAINDLLQLKSEGKNKIVNIGENAEKYVEIIEERKNNPEKHPFIRTCYSEINRISGGFRGKEVTALVAPPGTGKTTMLLNMMTYMAENEKNVMLFSLEMDKQKVVEKILASMTFIDSTVLRHGSNRSHITEKLYKAVTERFSKMNFYIQDGNLTIEEMVSLSKKYKIMYGLDFIGIDYFDLLDLEKKYGLNETGMEAKKAKIIKDLAKDLDIPVLCIAALKKPDKETKDGLNPKPTLNSVKGSTRIGYDSDTCFALWVKYKPERDYEKEEDPETLFDYGANKKIDDKIDLLQLLVLKNRNGDSGGEINMRFLKKYSLIEEI